MTYEDKMKSNSDYWSSFEDEMMAWQEIYNPSECEDYEISSDSAMKLFKPTRIDLDSFEFPSSFVSFDFENLFPQRVTACSVGMVKYKNGKKVEPTFYTLIRPPFEYEGKRGPALTWIHGFTENDFEGQPTFAEVLPQMEAFIEGLPLVAHNACVEKACIHDACAYYNIETSIPYENIMDTLFLSKAIEKRLGMLAEGSGSHSLNVVCKRFGVKELKHHHACDDAEMCGNLFLVFPKFLSGELVFDETAWQEASKQSSNDVPMGNTIYDSYALRGHTSLCGDVLQKDLSCADPNNPFYDRKVVITGVFSIERQELAMTLKAMGADIDTGVGSKTNYLLIGDEPGPSKLRKFDQLILEGKDVRKIYQEDLDLILAGKEYDKYHTEKPFQKPKVATIQERKTTWPNLVEKFKRHLGGEDVEFTERELNNEDYRLLSMYYKQQQKIPMTKATALDNLRQLDEACEREFRKEILACFEEGEILTKKHACERMQRIFTKYGLPFKAKTCVLKEYGVEFKEYKHEKVLHLNIKTIPQF